MSLPFRALALCLVLLVPPALSCAPTDEDQGGSESDAVAVNIVVDHDNYLGFSVDRIIGDIWFSDSVGIIGTPVDVVVQVKEQDFARFSDELVVGTITLRNPEITKGGQDVIEFTLDSRREEFDFVVPQVETVPAVLTYDVLLYVENPGDANEYFEASLVYQFLVNQGTPAT